MKKKFQDRKIGKFLTSPIVRGALGAIPVAGPVLSNVLDEVREDQVSAPGEVNKTTIVRDVVAALATAVILYLALTGKISFEEAEQAKGLI